MSKRSFYSSGLLDYRSMLAVVSAKTAGPDRPAFARTTHLAQHRSFDPDPSFARPQCTGNLPSSGLRPAVTQSRHVLPIIRQKLPVARSAPAGGVCGEFGAPAAPFRRR
jgi:hypothetical protein